jgi:hypothetical protein
MEEADKLLQLQEWYNIKIQLDQVKPLIAQEMELRKKLGDLFFPEKVESTQTLELSQGWKLKYTYKVDRKIEEAAWPTVKAKLKEMKVTKIDKLVVMKPALAISAWKLLKESNPEALAVFEECLTTKPASPSLELVPPKV